MNQKFIFENMIFSYLRGDDGSLKFNRFEPIGYESVEKRQVAFEPFVLKTTDSTASPMEGCGSIPNVWDGSPCRLVKQDEKGLILQYFTHQGALEVTVEFHAVEGADVIRQINAVKNVSNEPITLTHFSSALVCGIAMGGEMDRWDKNKIKVHDCRSHWCGEAQWREECLEDLGIYRQSMHNWDMSSFRFSSTGTWSTGKYYPLVMVEDTECNRIWYIEHEGASNWTIELGCLNNCGEGFLMLEANSADEATGFVHTLHPNESYTATPCVFGCTNGGFEEAVRELTKYKRTQTQCRWEKGYAPAVFNDYMNCLWALPSREKLIPLIDAAAEAGAEVFCMDDGWQLESLGTWSIDNEKYGEGGLQAIVDYIKKKGMTAGIWLELEACERNRYLYRDDCLVHRHGAIVNPDRAHVNFESQEAREYLMGIIDRFYAMGIRYIKNDHNRSTLIGNDDGGVCNSVGLRRTTDAFLSFIDEVRRKYPDLVIENCASGAMRSDFGTLSHFALQSVSDQEYYDMTSSITVGSLAFLPPEKAGVWAYPYPVSFANRENDEFIFGEQFQIDRADGEETIYNMVTALCGTLYLSGRIDRADQWNAALIKEGVEKFKQIREHNAHAYPIYPMGRWKIGDTGTSCFGLLSDDSQKMTLAVWHRTCDADTIAIDLKKYLNSSSTVAMTYPQNPMGATFSFDSENQILSVRLPSKNSARFFEVEVN